MNVAFAYNVKNNQPSLDLAKQNDIDFDSPEVIQGIKTTLESLGHTVLMIEADNTAFEKLRENKGKIDILFNIAEGLSGDARESQIPIFCEMLQIPYTHSSPTTHAVKLNKQYSKLILKAKGIRVPEGFTVSSKDYVIPANLSYPLFVKPNKEGSSKGVFDKNVIHSESELRERIEYVSENFTCEVLVEEFIDGREFTVGAIGTPPRILPIIEQKFDFLPAGFNKIASYELKWIYEDNLKDPSQAYDCPAKLEKTLEDQIVNTTLKVWEILDIKDAARIDYRLNQAGELFFLEVNTLPGINPDESVISYLPLAARIGGLSYKDLVNQILMSAVSRYKLSI